MEKKGASQQAGKFLLTLLNPWAGTKSISIRSARVKINWSQISWDHSFIDYQSSRLVLLWWSAPGNGIMQWIIERYVMRYPRIHIHVPRYILKPPVMWRKFEEHHNHIGDRQIFFTTTAWHMSFLPTIGYIIVWPNLSTMPIIWFFWPPSRDNLSVVRRYK